MSIDNWTKVKNELIGENADMYVISSENITVSKFEFRETIDCTIAMNEQIVVVEGEMTIKHGEKR